MSFKYTMPVPAGCGLSRRQFVTGTAGALFGAASFSPGRALADESAIYGLTEISGQRFDLDIGYRAVNLTGKTRQATVVNGSLPAPVLRWREGDEVVINVRNNLAVDSSIHWHGIILPAEMDGVPGFSFDGIQPGETFQYRFPLLQNGTYWYHSHSGFQEQTGHYGALIIDPREPAPYTYDREHVVMLSDWSDEKPERIFAKLKKEGHYYNQDLRTLQDTWRQLRGQGVGATWDDRAMWNDMRMNDRDIADVTAATYTYLVNGITPDGNWQGLFKKGERVLLRVVNASAMTIFDLRIPGLKMTVVASDGQYVEPVTVDEIRLGVAETYDVIVEPDEGAYTLFAQSIDRGGYARGTLTEAEGLSAPVPELDPRPVLSHADMGMGHGGHAGHDMGAMDHSGHDMSGMDHSGHDMGGMDHSQHAGHDMNKPNAAGIAPAGMGSSAPVVHADTEFGFQVDMRADQPVDQLNDPGLGLRNNGRHVLTYGELRNLYPTPDPRDPMREIQLHLTGNMKRYMWSMDGIRFADAEPLPLKLNERVRIVLVNDTMMTHPIHLHGMWSDLETGDPDRIPRKHTITVQPGARISYLVTPDMPGDWAYHCHLLYHMMGMFRRVRVT